MLLQIKHCDSILEHMEGLLGKFQTDLGQVSEEIRALQVRQGGAEGLQDTAQASAATQPLTQQPARATAVVLEWELCTEGACARLVASACRSGIQAGCWCSNGKSRVLPAARPGS